MIKDVKIKEKESLLGFIWRRNKRSDPQGTTSYTKVLMKSSVVGPLIKTVRQIASSTAKERSDERK